MKTKIMILRDSSAYYGEKMGRQNECNSVLQKFVHEGMIAGLTSVQCVLVHIYRTFCRNLRTYGIYTYFLSSKNHEHISCVPWSTINKILKGTSYNKNNVMIWTQNSTISSITWVLHPSDKNCP